MLIAAAMALGWAPSPHGLRGDINGDGRADSVSLVRRPRFFVLRVDTGSRAITKVVRGFSGWPASSIGDPHIVALRPMNSQRGLEIEVEVWHGASTVELIFYALHRGRLVPMTGAYNVPGDPAFVWNIGGTIGTGSSQADCVRPRQVGVFQSWHHRGVWHYRTTLYDARVTRSARGSVYELASERMVENLPRDWPKVRRLDFASCGGVVAPQ